MKTKTVAYAVMFAKDFLYYGGVLDRLAVFETIESARAYAEMFGSKGKCSKKKYKIQKVAILPCKKKTP